MPRIRMQTINGKPIFHNTDPGWHNISSCVIFRLIFCFDHPFSVSVSILTPSVFSPLKPCPSSLYQFFLVPSLPYLLSSLPLFCLTEVSILQRLARRWLRLALHIRLQLPWEQLAVHSYLSASILSPPGVKLGSFKKDIKMTPPYFLSFFFLRSFLPPGLLKFLEGTLFALFYLFHVVNLLFIAL